HGIPDTIVSDNGTGFTSLEFRTFLSRNGIAHILTPPYHPSSNGQAERYVQSLKSSIGKMLSEEGTIYEKLCRFLMEQHACPSSVTGKSPSELLFGRTIKTRLDLIRPTPEEEEHKFE